VRLGLIAPVVERAGQAGPDAFGVEWAPEADAEGNAERRMASRGGWYYRASCRLGFAGAASEKL
jgi:hypothetical protein